MPSVHRWNFQTEKYRRINAGEPAGATPQDTHTHAQHLVAAPPHPPTGGRSRICEGVRVHLLTGGGAVAGPYGRGFIETGLWNWSRWATPPARPRTMTTAPSLADP